MKREMIVRLYLFKHLVKACTLLLKQKMDDFFLFLFMSWMESIPFPMTTNHISGKRFIFKMMQLFVFAGLILYWPIIFLPLFVILIVGGHRRGKRDEMTARHIWH